MFIGHFTERPYQDQKSGYFGATGKSIRDLDLSKNRFHSIDKLRNLKYLQTLTARDNLIDDCYLMSETK